MAGYDDAGPSAAQMHLNQTQSHVVQTMLLVSAFYAVSWLPNHIFVLFLQLNPTRPLPGAGYYASVIIAFLYIGANPFIYAAKFDPVRKVLLRLAACKTSASVSVNVISVQPRTVTAADRRAHQ